ncbi:MAG: hypothetical protein ABSH01_27485 [Terriglobia bacterium]
MRLVSTICERLKSLGLGYRVGIWVLAVWTGLGAPTVGISWQHRLRLAQDTPPNQQDQTKSQTPQEPRNPADQPIPEGEQGQVETGSEPSPPSAAEQGDEMLAGIQAVLGNVPAPDLGVLGQAFDTTVKKQDEASSEPSAVELIELGDLDGDGVSEVALKLLVTETSQEDTQGQASPPSLRGLYLLSWDGTRWKASRLAAPAENFQFKVVRLGKSTGRCIAVVNVMGEAAVPYPAIFQLREHEAALLWDSQGGDNRYNALEHGQIEFQDNAKLDQTDMIVIGRADPGLLQFEPGGHRGFSARCVYHWDGQAYVPAQTEYSPGPDNTLYRFIAALHLHNFRSAYTLIDPGKFLKTDAPSLEKFRQMIEENWREFLDDQVFQAREANAGSPDALAFELPEKHYVYRPTLSNDGKFLLIGLERKVEMPGTGSGQDSP